jgi:hypothetical protein
LPRHGDRGRIDKRLEAGEFDLSQAHGAALPIIAAGARGKKVEKKAVLESRPDPMNLPSAVLLVPLVRGIGLDHRLDVASLAVKTVNFQRPRPNLGRRVDNENRENVNLK